MAIKYLTSALAAVAIFAFSIPSHAQDTADLIASSAECWEQAGASADADEVSLDASYIACMTGLGFTEEEARSADETVEVPVFDDEEFGGFDYGDDTMDATE